MSISISATEIELFRTCTAIQLGDGQNVKFWHDRWISGQAPKDLAPSLFRLAWRKNISVAQALNQGHWMSGLRRISTTEEVSQFVNLWHLLSQTRLTDRTDSIAWRFTSTGKYSAKSAYSVQFHGSFADHNWQSIWKAKAENKCKFFCWLALQNRLWTADRIIKHGGQSIGICNLCYTHQESALHMLATCPYSVAVWNEFQAWLVTSLQAPPATRYRTFKAWWNSMIRIHDQNALERLQRVVYTAWHIWKERCRRVFDSKGISVTQLQELIRHDLQQWMVVWHGSEQQLSVPD
jgi:hypothetical protein